MDFDFNTEQYAFQRTVRALLEQRCDLNRVSALAEGRSEIDLWPSLAELGVFSMMVPEEYGGLGLNYVDLGLVLEEFGRALLPPPVIDTLLIMDVLCRFATNAQKERFLPGAARGMVKFAFALTEPKGGFGLGDITAAARATQNGWCIQGCKILVPFAPEVDWIVVAARFDAPGEPFGLALCKPASPGVSLRQHDAFDPSGRFYEMSLNDVHIIRADVVGEEPSSESLQWLVDSCGMAAALQMTGLASKVLELSVDYATQRVQFDRPIGSFQAIKHKCADMAVAVEASRSAAYYAAWALAENASDLVKAVSMAKSFCSDTSRFVCNEGIQIHGGMGFTWELGLHLYLRRAKLLEYSYGDAAFHRERVLTHALLELDRAG